MTLQATARLIEPIGITYTTRTEDFRKRLTALCASKKPTQEMMTITPAMAGIMLERNRENNRPIVKAAVAQYARAIKEGRWTITSQGIGFDSKGHLFDGQHRLTAVIEADRPITTWVAFGLDPDNFAHVDRGRVRTPSHILGIAGYENTNVLAAAARLCFLVSMGDLNMSSYNARSVSDGGDPDPEMLLAFITENPKLVELTKHIRTYVQFRPLGASCGLAAHFLIASKHPMLADAFMEQVCLGENLKRNDTVYRLRQRLMSAWDKHELVFLPHRVAWCIDSFNATRQNREIKQFKVVPGREFPKVGR